MKSLAILGSTGSIGTQTLNVLQRNPDQYNVMLLVANSNWPLLEKQIRAFSPRWAVMYDVQAAQELKKRVADLPVHVLTGQGSLLELLERERFDLVVAAMVGHSGLLPVLTAIQAGSDIALANKEVLVMAGHLVTSLARQQDVKILPLDSEHSAIFQCLEGHPQGLRKIVLTASGGPFRGNSRAELKGVSPAAALKHPNWQMGAKISVDSATLMNKGLEIIEARWLFAVDPDQIEVLVHPQSIIHSMVEFIDGTVLAQLGVASMELPIQYALFWPERRRGGDDYFLDWRNFPSLTFEQPDTETFVCLRLAQEALARGGNAPTALSAANDICVEEFLAGNLPFNSIPTVIADVIENIPWQANPDLPSILETMNLAVARTRQTIITME